MGVLAVLLHEESLYFSEEHLDEIYEKTTLLSHRGEKNNFYHDDQIALGCQTDDQLAEQPFQFHNNRYTLIFDGIIYNLSELRNNLTKAGYVFETNMDTEVLANLFLYKRTKCFEFLRGSFVLLIWDQEMKVLYGGRDRFGIKPLYYMQSNEEAIFASEKKSMLFVSYEERIDDAAFHQYLDHKYVPDPYTMTRGIRKVRPGHYFIKKMDNPITFHRYFHATFHPEPEKQANLPKVITKALHESIRTQIDHTGSNGIILSNHVYSSILAALMKNIDPNVKALSVYHPNDQLAEEVARNLQIEYHSIAISPNDFIVALPEIIWLLDDPFADLTSVTTYFVATLAKQQVSSVVSSEGADEILGEVHIPKRKSRLFTKAPKAIQHLPNRVRKAFSKKGPFASKSDKLREPVFTKQEKRQLLKRIVTQESIQKELLHEVKNEHPVIRKQYVNLHSDLSSNRLCQIEKIFSAHSLKLHFPILDKQLFSELRSMPVKSKTEAEMITNVAQSLLSKELVAKLLSAKQEEPIVPLGDWLRNECYSWAKRLIDESGVDYLIDKEIFRTLLKRHVYYEEDHTKQIWTVLVFMLWHQIYIEGQQ